MAVEMRNNPFADYGNMVYGDRFIGRKKEISEVHQRVLGNDYGNLAIIGLPRVGKSSLAWQSIMENKKELLAKKTIPIFFNIGACPSPEEFFKQLVNDSFEELGQLLDDNSIQVRDNAKRDIIDSLKNEFDKSIVKRYFRLLKSNGYKSIFILDEFDNARDIFDMSDFQFLRELAYNPQTKICLVTCSRKSLHDIEKKHGGLSKFEGIFTPLYLGMFSQEDVELYWEHFKDKWEGAANEQYKAKVAYHCGNLPFLMDMINFKMFQEDISNLSSNFETAKLEFIDQFKRMYDILEAEKLLNAAIQLVLGPLYDVKQEQIEMLSRYGFIRPVSLEEKKKVLNLYTDDEKITNDVYLCFSDYNSLDLYRSYYAKVPYFLVWSKTENRLRSIIKEYLSMAFPNGDWETGLENDLRNNLPWMNFDMDKWKQNLENLKKNKNKMVKNFPFVKDDHLVDFTLTSQIFDIFIFPKKSWFNTNIFTGDWNDWNSKFNHLKIVRDPFAHNNANKIKKEIEEASKYCDDISKAIDVWDKKRTPTP